MGQTSFTWIGTGSAFNPFLGHTSFLVTSGGPRTLLVDCGATVPLKLIEQERIGCVTDVLITHTHADHIGGLEGLAFFCHYVLNRRGAQRPVLHLASDEIAQELWTHGLQAGMGKSHDEERTPQETTLETFFQVRIGRRFQAEGLPAVDFLATQHVAGMENYGLQFGNGVFYSGDSVELPPHHPRLIFQDCQMIRNGPADVHISYEELLKSLPETVRRKTYLTHLNVTHAARDPLQDGFGGYVMPGQTFLV